MEEETKFPPISEEHMTRARAYNIFRIFSRELDEVRESKEDCECGRNMKPNLTEKDFDKAVDNVFGVWPSDSLEEDDECEKSSHSETDK